MNPRSTVLLLFSIATAACAPEWTARGERQRISAAIHESVSQGPGAELSLSRVTPFEWERVFVFGPYTPVLTVQDSLGVLNEDAALLARRINERDDINLLVFRLADGEYRSVAHPRQLGDFAPEAVGRGYPAPEALFLVRTPPPGSWGDLIPQAQGAG